MEKQGNIEQIDQARNALTDGLKQRGIILSNAVECAFRVVPRHVLLQNIVDPIEAYADKTIVFKRDEQGSVFEKGRTLSSSTMPGLVAAMLEFLDVRPGMKVLEIGTASGYNAALLAEIADDPSKVYTIEIDKDVAQRAQRCLREAGYGGIHVIHGDGGYGYVEAAPYDRISVTAGCSDFSPYWLDQLKEGASLIAPFCFSDRGGIYPVLKLTKIGGEYIGEFTSGLCGVGFVPLYGDFETLTYDGAISDVLENMYRRRWSAKARSKDEAHGRLLLAMIHVAHCIEAEQSFLKEDDRSINSLSTEVEKAWISLGQPTPSDFSLRLLNRKTEPQEGGWVFQRENWNILVYAKK